MGLDRALFLEYSKFRAKTMAAREKDIKDSIRAQDVDVWRPLDRTNPASRRMNVAVGRKAAKRFEAALGQEVVAIAKAKAAGQEKPTAAVQAIVLPLSDEQMGKLSRAADPLACGAEWAEAMGVLLDCKVPQWVAGQILGIEQTSESSRLASMSAWPPALLALARKHSLTRHQMRWLDGLSVEKAQEVIRAAGQIEEEKRRERESGKAQPGRNKRRRTAPTVASLREAAEIAKATPSPAPSEASAFQTESERLSRVLGTEVRVSPQGEGFVLEAVYFSAEGLAGVLEWLGKGRGEAPHGGSKRTLKLELESLEELTYFTGTEED
jgi:hypothetical protein